VRAALYYAQRGIVQATIRSAITSGLAAAINWRHPSKGRKGDGILHAPECSTVLRSLETEGIAILPECLPEQVKEMNRFLSDKPVVLRTGERSGQIVPHDRVPHGCTMADYQLETVLNCPHVLALANSDFLIRTATQYLGCLPTISTLRIWWTFPGSRREDFHLFHRDWDDWRCVKLFVYLTEVDETSGRIILCKGAIEPSPSCFGVATRPRRLRKPLDVTPSASSQALPGPRSLRIASGFTQGRCGSANLG